MLNIFKILSFFSRHPLTKEARFEAYKRFFGWQFLCRMTGKPVIVPFVDNTRLIMERGITSATGNYYAGLMEFNDMAFLLHFLKENDLFMDVGANVGVYTILASGVRKAQSIAFEPIPSTFRRLQDHIRINGLEDMAQYRNYALGSKEEKLYFTTNEDSTNHVVPQGSDASKNGMEVRVCAMDSIMEGRCPLLMKIDVEGFETEVIRGASETLKNPELKAIIIELNGLGANYGFSDDEIHRELLDYGFKPQHYEPFQRTFTELDHYGNHNTIYIRDLEWVKDRVAKAPRIEVLGKSF